jgi:3-oxoacyl-[acyl-carrier protein] reductase
MTKGCVLVTGGGKGIGKAIALEFAQNGFDVCINYFRSEPQALKTLAEIKALGVKAIAVQADISKEAQVRQMVGEVRKQLGPITVIVNNSGIYAFTPGKPFTELEESEWDEVMNTNAKGAWLVCKHAVPLMVKDGIKGSIVNISSIAGIDAARAGVHYGASKAAVVSLTKSLCMEAGKFGIRVNSIAPGAVKTDLLAKVPAEKNEKMRLETPLGRLSTVEDIAKAVYALAMLQNVSGQTLVVDGGRLKH